MKFNKRFYKKEESGKEKRPSDKHLKSLLMIKEKVPPKVRKLNALIVEV